MEATNNTQPLILLPLRVPRVLRPQLSWPLSNAQVMSNELARDPHSLLTNAAVGFATEMNR